jgi:hypothetical protein
MRIPCPCPPGPRSPAGPLALAAATALVGVACDDVRVRRDLALYDDLGAPAPDAADATATPADASEAPPRDGGASIDAREPPRDRPASDTDALWATDARAVSADGFPAAADAAPDTGGGDAGPSPPDLAVPPPGGDAGGAGPDAAPPPLDAGVPEPDAAPVEDVFLTGVIRPADERTPVTVEAPALGLSAQALPPDFTFTLGPLPADAPVDLRAAAEAHQTETLRWDPTPGAPAVLPEPFWLYRGLRLSDDLDAERLFFGGGDDWLLWSAGDVLSVAPVNAPGGPGRGRVLVPSAYELFLGYTPGPENLGAVVRRRGEPGLAGDVEVFPLAGGAGATLFREAQPWVRWVDHRALALVRTRQALSQLVLAAPGGPIEPLAEGVPWLLVTRLQSGEVAYAAGAAPEYEVRLDALDGEAPRTVSPVEAPAGDAFLSTSPDGRRLYWRTPAGALWVYDRTLDAARAIADDVAPTPRPTLLADGSVYFWRGAPEAAELFLYDAAADRETLRATGVDARTFYPTGDGFFVVAPGSGLLHGLRAGDAPAALAVRGATIQFAVTGPGALVLADGLALTFVPGSAPVRRGGEGLTRLEIAPTGATAWQAAGGRLWYVPGPGRPGDATPITAGGAGPERVTEPAREAIYVRDVGPWRRLSLPPGAAPEVVFGAEATALLPLDATRVLGADATGTLRLFDPDTGAATGWARHVEQIERGPLRRFAAYTCDRGVFVVPLTAEPE